MRPPRGQCLIMNPIRAWELGNSRLGTILWVYRALCLVGMSNCSAPPCLVCPAGKFANSSGTCVYCPTLYFTPNAGLTSCDKCPAGYVSLAPYTTGCEIGRSNFDDDVGSLAVEYALNLEIYGNTFGLIGALLSSIGALVMLVLLLSDSRARRQVRPRLLIVLAFCDFLGAIFTAVDNILVIKFEKSTLQQQNQGDDPLLFTLFNNGIGSFFFFASYTWTCVVAFHVYVVLRNDLEPNSAAEKQYEKLYWGIVFVAMICVYLPCMVQFEFVEHPATSVDDDDVGAVHYEAVQSAFLLAQQLWVFAMAVTVHRIEARTPEAQAYRKQVRRFLLVFLVLGGPFLVFFLYNTCAPSSFQGRIRKEFSERRLGFTLWLGFFGVKKDEASVLELPLLANEVRADRTPSQVLGRGCTGVDQLVAHAEIPAAHVQVGQSIGRGGFGMVFRGTYLGNAVAVKEVKLADYEKDALGTDSSGGSGSGGALSASAVTRSAAEKALNEAAILAELRHPNTVIFYGLVLRPTDTSKMTPLQARHAPPLKGYYFVQEMCDTALNRVDLGVGQTPGSELYEMLVQVARGMRYLHSKEILHRDLKPGNVLVQWPSSARPDESAQRPDLAAEDKRGRAGGAVYKLCDFGLARMMLGASDAGELQLRERSMTGNIGTSLYMAPEMLANDKAQLEQNPFAADVFSYGVLAWQVLSGDRPYVGDSALSGMNIHQIKREVTEGYRPQIPSDEGWPLPMAALLKSCWAHKVEDRPSFESIVSEIGGLQLAFADLLVDAENPP